MKHTSIRLSEDHAARIAGTGESPTAIIKKALDAYFNMDPARELMAEHLRLYHSARSEHTISTKHNVPQVEHKAQNEHIVITDKPQSASVPRDVAHDKHKNSAQIEHTMSTEVKTGLEFIASELRENREPTSREVADKVGMKPTGLSMMLSKYGIRPQNTKRQMKAVKIFTKPMLAKIEEILGQAGE